MYSNVLIALVSTSDPGRLSESSMLFNFCVISALTIANEILKYVTSFNIYVWRQILFEYSCARRQIIFVFEPDFFS